MTTSRLNGYHMLSYAYFYQYAKKYGYADHFLPKCFWFTVLYTIYSSDLAVLYLGHAK